MAQMITDPGIYLNYDVDAYYSDPLPAPSLNQSLIPDLLDRSPYHMAFKHPRLNPYGGEATMGTKAAWLGSAVHRLALGRGREISAIRYPDYQSGSAREARDLAIANGRIPVLERELVKAQDMAVILKRQIHEALDGAAYETEVVIAWREVTADGEVWCRMMIDVWSAETGIALDPKALRTPAMPEPFGRNAAESGYDLQASFGRRGLETILPAMAGRIRFANLVVESFAPHGAQMMELGPTSRSIADWKVGYAIAKFGYCLHRRSWPSYPKGFQTFETPSWYQQQALARQFSEEMQ